MSRKPSFRNYCAGAVALFGTAACTGNYPPLTFTPDGSALRLNGVIDNRALEAFDEAVLAHPDTTTLIMEFVPGSADDESNLKLARKVRALGLNTVVPEYGLVASGGTDLFLAGVLRNLDPQACVGVHTWGNTLVGIGSETPKDDPIHQWYLDYYDEIGTDGAFYWFTLDAAGPDDSHWMTPSELNLYGVSTTDMVANDAATNNQRDTRCQERFDTEFANLIEGSEGELSEDP